MVGFSPSPAAWDCTINRSSEGRRLVNFRTTIQDEMTKIQKYTRTMALSDELLSEFVRQMKSSEGE